MFKFYYPLEHFTPYLLFGPRFDLLINIKPRTYGNIPADWPYESNESLWASKLLKSSYGGTLGIGLQMESILPIPILIEFCYNFDLSDNQMAAMTTWLLNFRNNVIPFLAQSEMGLPTDPLTLGIILKYGLIIPGFTLYIIGLFMYGRSKRKIRE